MIYYILMDSIYEKLKQYKKFLIHGTHEQKYLFIWINEHRGERKTRLMCL